MLSLLRLHYFGKTVSRIPGFTPIGGASLAVTSSVTITQPVEDKRSIFARTRCPKVYAWRNPAIYAQRQRGKRAHYDQLEF